MNKIVMAVLAVVAAGFFGCGKGSDGDLKVSKDGDTARYEVTTKEGKATIAASDTKVAIPDTFPKDVPIPKGAVAKLTMTQGKIELLHLIVPGSVGDVAKDYQDKLKAAGWEIETSMNMGESSMVAAKKGNRKCSVMVLKDENGTAVQLTVGEG